ncbi:uncharacterized protein LOC108682571 [Hyalella azteca]|uniref:Uncharacterized protein LOC108682571 n=1 Tax=Hyalella azteca TaxID=294128 RepID=A0A979FVH0_HYAAZ|nr:uncharacterized protein LOC108682571 [Hyalella azteca]
MQGSTKMQVVQLSPKLKAPRQEYEDEDADVDMGTNKEKEPVRVTPELRRGRGKRPVNLLCSEELSDDEKNRVRELVLLLCNPDTSGDNRRPRGEMIEQWTPNSPVVTHVIAHCTADRELLPPTKNVAIGVATGAWVVTMKWVTTCLEKRCLLHETEYEARDATGRKGPNLARRAQNHRTSLLHDFVFSRMDNEYLSEDEMRHLVRLSGGQIEKFPPLASAQPNRHFSKLKREPKRELKRQT